MPKMNINLIIYMFENEAVLYIPLEQNPCPEQSSNYISEHIRCSQLVCTHILDTGVLFELKIDSKMHN